MPTYTTRPSHAADPAGVHHEAQQAPARRTSPLLLALLVLAVVALAAWWAMQRYDARPVADTTPILIEPPAAATDATQARDGSAADRTAPRPAAIVSERPARPLAGNPVPDYPRAALRAGQEGSVLLSISVDARGVPADVQVIQRSGDRSRDLDRAAIEAVRQWRFEPALHEGKAVPSTVQLPVDFRRS
ncbi:energy transducer TonB [Pseudoxanthomonas sp. J35]|uniref:energy transducer TonB n=1 Tax=Pseudoxanthomonas sp. J35 TaxID=935852 RepID=UPI0004AEB1A7|nr:energy transducer TonB [Pseudoxanthomonas sp. J35]